MPKTIEMIVTLKVPDTTAITALQTLHKLGFDRITGLKRADYYKFSFDGDLEKFKEKISKVDILVNANKHSANFEMPTNNSAKILVRNVDDNGEGLLSTLKNRIGVTEASKIERGTLWMLETNEKNPAKIAEKAARELLANEHYQEFRIL